MTKINLPSERRVGHLKLLRQGREISVGEFNKLSAGEQLDIIRSLRGKEKYDLIINTDRAKKLVPRLHPQEIYLTVNELGAADVTELLTLASSDQISLLLDMDCWDGDNLSQVLSLQWLELILATGQEKACQLIRELEPEILALFLKKHITITHGIEVFDSDDIETAKRLESLYDVDYASEDAAKVIGALLKIWMENEQESYLLVMEMIRSEQLSTLEEEVYQARNNRLLDLGIIPAIEARTIYTYVDPDSFSGGGKSDFALEADELSSPMALLTQAQPGNLLADILEAGIDHPTACELLMLVNRKISADNVDFSDHRQVSQALQETYDTINLALEFLAGKDAEKAETTFNTTYLVQLFQLGHSLIRQRQTAAEAVAASTLYPYLDYPDLLFIDSLLETPPGLYLPEDDESPASLQPLKTMNDLKTVDLRLKQIAALDTLFCHGTPFCLEPVTEDAEEIPSLAQLFITATANQLLGRDFTPEPLSRSDLKTVRDRTTEEGDLTPDFVAQFHALVESLVDHGDFFAGYCLDFWADSFIAERHLEPEDQGSAFLTSI